MKRGIIVLLLSLLLVITACTPVSVVEEQVEELPVAVEELTVEEVVLEEPELEEVELEPELLPEPETGITDWREWTLKDVRTGDTFKVSDFAGTPVLLESFAVWCPTCTRQQKEFIEFHEVVGDSVVSISLDTDPNEDEERVLEHVTKNGFDWRYAIAPSDMTQQLIDQFGVGVVNAPSVPVILVCEDQSSRLLPRGVKDTQELQQEIEAGC